MDIRAEIIREHSKEMADRVSAYVIDHPLALDALMACFFDPDLRICQRAAWPVCKLGIGNPQLLEPYMEAMISNLSSPRHVAVVRNTVRVWAEMDIKEEYEGRIVDLCLDYLCDPKVAVAVRAFSISVAGNIARKYPELAQELVLELKNQLIYETKPAVLVRARKYLKLLEKVV
jgi:hypothetical protein